MFNNPINPNNTHGWSAGCQVVANPIEFRKLLTVRDLAIKSGQNTFGYTLLLKSDFA